MKIRWRKSNPTAHGITVPIQTLEAIRSQILNTALLAIAIAMFFALAASLYRVVDVGWRMPMALHIVAFPLLLGIALFRHRLSFHVRALGLLGLGYLISIAGLISWGLVGLAIPCLMSLAIFTAVIAGARYGVISVVFAMAVMSMVGLLVSLGKISFGFDITVYSTAPSSWLTAVINSGAYMAVIVASLGRLHGSLIASIGELNEQTLALSQANVHLKAEIEQRKRAEKALQQSEERFRSLVETTSDWIWEVDREGRYTYASPKVTDLLGYRPEEILGKHPFDLMRPHEAQRVEMLYETHVQEKAPFSRLENTNLHKTNREVVIETSGVPILDTEGNLKGFRGIDRDITARKRAEEAIRETEERYRQLIQNANDVIYWTDPLGHFTLVNPSAQNLMGYSHEELLGKHFLKLIREDVREEAERFYGIQFVKRIPNTYFEFPAIAKDGKEIWIGQNVHLVTEGDEVTGFQAVARDITERVRAEEALKESESKYRNILDSIEEGYFESDLSGHFSFVNTSQCSMIGYTANELLGTNYRKYVTEETAKTLYDAFNKIYRTGNPEKLVDYEVIRKDGNKRIHEMSASLMRDAFGAPVGFRGVCRDMTETIRLRDQLQHAQKIEAMGTLASGVAHNFRNILAGVSVNSQLLKITRKEDPPLMEIAHRIQAAVEKGANLVDGLMQFSHKKATKKTELLNLTQVIEETCDLITKSFDKSIHIETDLSQSLPIMGDHSGLSQVLMNLFTNSRDAMASGGRLRILAVSEGPQAKVTVSDTGCGMDRETVKRCFDPFFTTKEIGKGTGLGLSTSYGIVKDLGGEISVHSESGKGTTFIISLPLVPFQEADRNKPVSQTAGGRGERILVVDDEAELLKPIEELLQVIGYDTAFASSGREALSTYESWRPDVVLLDRSMPEMDGITCARKIISRDPGARIVLFSGYEEDGPDGIDARTREFIKGYLTKPIDITELSRLLSQLLSE